MVLAAILGGPYSIARREGDAGCHQGARWGCESPPRAMGIRGATKDRVGVGAVQNRPTSPCAYLHRAGDAGQPAHQRHKNPNCARPRDAPIPTRLRPHRASISTPMPTNAPKPRAARGASRRRFPPRCMTMTADPHRAAPRCADSHPSATPPRVDPHPDTHQRSEIPSCARHHQRSDLHPEHPRCVDPHLKTSRSPSRCEPQRQVVRAASQAALSA
jgi:hypothetical protein